MTQDNFDLVKQNIEDFIDFEEIVTGNVALAIGGGIDDIVGEIEDVLDDELEKLFEELDKLADTQINLNDQVLIGLDQLQRDQIADLRKIEINLQGKIEELEGELEDVIKNSEQKLQLSLIRQEIELGIIVQDTENKVRKEISDAVEDIEDDNESVRQKITGFLGDRFDDINDAQQAITGKVESVAEAVSGTVGGALGTLPEMFGNALGNVFAVITNPLKTLFDFFDADKIRSELVEQDSIFSAIENDPDAGAIYSNYTKTGVPALAVGAIGAIIGVVVVTPIQIGMAYFSGLTERIRQNSFKRFKPQQWSLPELRELKRRQVISSDREKDQMERLGFDDDNLAEAEALVNNLLGVQEIIALWRREEITEDDTRNRLSKLGFDPTDTSHIQTLGFGIPPIQDLITFAVREAFQLDIAERFGQLFGLPDDIRQAFNDNLAQFGSGPEGSLGAFAEFAKRQGIKPEWIATYWAAHWREPGLTQLYNMVHRLAPDIVENRREDFEAFGLDINKLPFELEDLKLGLQKQDLTPFWWERLTAIAFQPLTRVDVRRMHSLGLIDRDEVKRRYRELGFSPGDAELMTQFTEAFNEEPEEIEDTETRDLTRAQILSFFEDGLMRRDEAKLALIDIGFNTDTAETILIDRELTNAKRETDLAVRTVEIRFDNELIDFNEASGELDGLLLSPTKRDNILARLEAEVSNRVRLPSRAELDKFRKEGIITPDLYREQLIRLGYPDEWADRFVTLNGGEIEVEQ